MKIEDLGGVVVRGVRQPEELECFHVTFDFGSPSTGTTFTVWFPDWETAFASSLKCAKQHDTFLISITCEI